MPNKKKSLINRELGEILIDLAEAKRRNNAYQWHKTEKYYQDLLHTMTSDDKTDNAIPIQSINNLISRAINEKHPVIKTFVKAQQNTVGKTPPLTDSKNTITPTNIHTTEAPTENSGHLDQPNPSEQHDDIGVIPSSAAPELPANSNNSNPPDTIDDKELIKKRQTMLEPIRKAMQSLKEQELLLQERNETVVAGLIQKLYDNIDNANAAYESNGNLEAYTKEMKSLLDDKDLRDTLSTHRRFVGKAITKIVSIVNNILESLTKLVAMIVPISLQTTGVNKNLFFQPIKTRSQEDLEQLDNAFKGATKPK